jgi:TamB, inner membrane protein subunit of TAM complex
LDATGGVIIDAEKNRATVEGGLTHDRLTNFGLKARMIAPKFVCLNTTRADNPLFYGKAVGAGDIRFTGNFDKPDIKVIATAGKGTKIVFPFAKEQNATELKFVKFKNKNLVQDSTRSTIFSEGVPGSKPPSRVKDLSGVSFDMDLTLTPEAETNLIFDEVAGDNIKAWGTGDLQLTFERGGEMEMKGQYNIVKGDYLFTLLRVVNKNFAIKEGGFIKWNGSPFDAQISIDAAYKGLMTSPHNLIEEYLVGAGADVVTEAGKPTPVDLTLRLQGAMLKPDVGFEVGFPKLTGQLKNFVDNKIRTLRQEPNELNRQMFGLVLVGGFLPSDVQFLGAQQLQTGGVNTAAELLSSMMNRFLADYVKGVDLQVGYNIAGLDNIQNIGKAEHRVQFKAAKTFGKDERWNIAAGVGVERKVLSSDELFVGGDFIVEYAITEDRRFKIRISQTYDQVLDGKRYKPALGIRYRREFDSTNEFLSIFKREKK